MPGLFYTLKMEAVCSSETSANIYQTTWRNIPEYNLQIVYYATSVLHVELQYEIWKEIFLFKVPALILSLMDITKMADVRTSGVTHTRRGLKQGNKVG
jgi:hypothetical protein